MFAEKYFLFENNLIYLNKRESDITTLNTDLESLLKMGRTRPLFRLFQSDQSNITIFTTNQCEKCPSSIWHWDSNSQPPPLTTRPGLPPKLWNLYSGDFVDNVERASDRVCEARHLTCNIQSEFVITPYNPKSMAMTQFFCLVKVDH